MGCVQSSDWREEFESQGFTTRRPLKRERGSQGQKTYSNEPEPITPSTVREDRIVPGFPSVPGGGGEETHYDAASGCVPTMPEKSVRYAHRKTQFTTLPSLKRSGNQTFINIEKDLEKAMKIRVGRRNGQHVDQGNGHSLESPQSACWSSHLDEECSWPSVKPVSSGPALSLESEVSCLCSTRSLC